MNTILFYNCVFLNHSNRITIISLLDMEGGPDDDADYIFYGSKILDQEFSSYRKAPQDTASTRSLPTHKQVSIHHYKIV
jgi:hypothetical protein